MGQSPTVRAKFVVQGVNLFLSNVGKYNEKGEVIYEPGTMASVKLAPVYANQDPQHENSRFWVSTPQGAITMDVVFPEAIAAFEVGQEMYVDFTPVPKETDQEAAA